MELEQGARVLKARITHLEMRARPGRRLPAPLGQRIAVMAVRSVPLSFYRYLYREIGKPHHWLLRRDLPDERLAAILHAPTNRIEVLYVEGAPAGFFELDLSRVPGEAEILYFGLIPDYQGRGLSRFFLSEAVHAAWDAQPERVVIHTNTLDSPRALQLYQKAGFEPYAWSEEEVPVWV